MLIAAAQKIFAHFKNSIMKISAIQSQASALYGAPTVTKTLVASRLEGEPYSASLSTTSSINDSVNISSEGMRRANEDGDSNPSTESISHMLHSMPDKSAVASFVEYAATKPDEALVSIGPAPTYTTHYSGTQILVTEKSTADFKSRANEVQAERLGIYQEEKAKGTDPADIWDKMANFMHSLPEDYKSKASGWGKLG